MSCFVLQNNSFYRHEPCNKVIINTPFIINKFCSLQMRHFCNKLNFINELHCKMTSSLVFFGRKLRL